MKMSMAMKLNTGLADEPQKPAPTTEPRRGRGRPKSPPEVLEAKRARAQVPPRAREAAALYAQGLNQSEIAVRMGRDGKPLSRQRVNQLLDRAGVERRPLANDAAIDAAIDAARARGLVARGDVMMHALSALEAAGVRGGMRRVRARAVARWGKRQFVPPLGTPDDWRRCSGRCGSWRQPDDFVGAVCRSCHNERMQIYLAGRRRAQGVPTIHEHHEVRREANAARRARVLELVEKYGAETVADVLGVALKTVLAQARRARAERSQTVTE